MKYKLSRALATLREVLTLVWADASSFVQARLIAVLLLVIMASVLTALGPVALKWIIDDFTGTATGWSTSPVLLVGFYVLSQWLARSAGEIRGLIYARAERRMFRTLSERLFAHLMQLPLRFHLDRKTGAVNQTLENGLQGYQLILHNLVFTVLPVMAQLGTIIFVLIQLHYPQILVLFCAAVACYAVAFTLAAIRIVGPAAAASAAHVDANAALTDSLLNYETVKLFTAESVVQDRVRKALLRTEHEWVGFYRRYAVNGLGVATIYAAFLATAILYCVREVEGGRMTIGAFVLINTYMLQVVQPVEMLGGAVQSFSQGIAMLEKLLALFREKTEGSSAPPCLVPASGSFFSESSLPPYLSRGMGMGRVVFDNVTLAYSPGRPVVRDLSFQIPAGKTVAIVGSSGAGKSTIVRLLVRLFEPSAGAIYLDDQPISALSHHELRRLIAVVPQDTILFNDTIGYNIAFGKPGSSQREIEQAATFAHLHSFVMSMPDRYETPVGERGVKLSGGEKQRVSIARAAIKRPMIYVFDEATSSLDSKTEREIQSNLREISQTSTTLVIAHRLSTVVHADEILVLEGGTIVERGTHRALLQLRGRYAALWNAQEASPETDYRGATAS